MIINRQHRQRGRNNKPKKELNQEEAKTSGLKVNLALAKGSLHFF